MSERRAFPRWSVALECEARSSDGRVSGLISDLSENGVRLTCSRSPQVGQEFDFSWPPAANEAPVELHCVVRDANDSKVGVEFQKLSRANRLRILHFICDKQLSRADVSMSSLTPPDRSAS